MGRRFPLDFPGGGLVISGKPLLIQEDYEASDGTGGTVWDGSTVLAKYLEASLADALSGLTVLEVGCGVGVAGLAAAALGAGHVILTDLPYALDNTRAVVKANAASVPGRISVVELDWTAPQPLDADVILGADVVWVADLIPPLVDTLRELTQAATEGGADEAKHPLAASDVTGVGPLVLLAHQTRSAANDELLFSLLRPDFAVGTVPASCLHPDFSCDAIRVLEIQRRPVSQAQG